MADERMHRLSNPVRDYPWGSTTAIADLLGLPPDGGPRAELWMGAHPDAPSRLPDGRRLDEAVASDPAGLVGPAVRDRFGGRLPYLLKVLSAAAPLSLQVHPDAAQAAAGYADEQSRGVPMDAAERRYRDPHHKPEMVVALERFDALCGLRDPRSTLDLLAELDLDGPAWDHLRHLLSAGDDRTALRATVGWLLGGEDRVAALVGPLGRAAAARGDRPEHATVASLAEAYPGDPGVLVALLLNRVRLHRGEALYLPAGNIHAYLSGTALEVMASSDNVLRAGLTSKHVDAAELLRIADFTPHPLPTVQPERHGPVALYRPGADEFELALVDVGAGGPRGRHELPLSGPRILLVLRGELEVAAGEERARLARGESVLVPAAAGPLTVRGDGAAVAAGVPATRGGGS
jgi:mannose-6-phosphate isomerase